MENYQIYKQLNPKTKKFITEAFSWADFLSNNNFDINVKGNDGEVFKDKLIDKVDIITSSFFLTALNHDGDIKSIFNKNGISIGDFTKFCGNAKLKISSDATMTEAFDEIDLDSIIKTIVEAIEYNNNMGEIPFNIEDIEPRHIFDYLINTYYEVIEELVESEIEDADENEIYADATEEYNDYYDEQEKELMKKYGIDLVIDKNNEDEEPLEYKFGNITLLYDEGDINIVLEPGIVELEVPTIPNKNGERETIKLLTGSYVYKIGDKIANKESLEEFVQNFKKTPTCDFTIWDSKGNGTLHFEAYKEDMFYSGIDKDEDDEKEIELNVEKSSSNKYSLASLGNDITQKKFIKNPAMGRDKELDELEISLLYKEKDMSVCVVGDAGVGKTALVEGLCYRIQNGTVSDSLKDLRIIKLDISSLVADTKYVGTLEKKMESILKEASGDKNIILFIDEIHRAMGAGVTEGDNNSVAEMLKQYLDRGDVRVIGATTTDEYTEHIEPNTAFKTRFDIIRLKEPDDEVIYSIINDLIESYNKLGKPALNMPKDKRDNLIRGLISGTRRSFRDYKDRANNPRLIINIIKRAYAIANFQKSDEVTVDHILSSYNSCERIYKDSRDRQSKLIRNTVENEKPKKEEKGIILEFKPKKKTE